jgi:hypothetical protein
MLERIGADHLEENPFVACQPIPEDAVTFAVEHGLRVLAEGGGWLNGDRFGLALTEHFRRRKLCLRRCHRIGSQPLFPLLDAGEQRFLTGPPRGHEHRTPSPAIVRLADDSRSIVPFSDDRREIVRQPDGRSRDTWTRTCRLPRQRRRSHETAAATPRARRRPQRPARPQRRNAATAQRYNAAMS